MITCWRTAGRMSYTLVCRYQDDMHFLVPYLPDSWRHLTVRLDKTSFPYLDVVCREDDINFDDEMNKIFKCLELNNVITFACTTQI